jgi:AAA+ ATPase superfamily predicted ATPase
MMVFGIVWLLIASRLPNREAIRVYTDENKMLAYSIVGGIPHYLRQFDSSFSLSENITKNVLAKGCVLYSEVEFLIRQELREPALYNTIIEAIALGNTRFNDIYTKTQIEKSKISVYLKNLIELQILEREFSVLSVRGAVSSGKEQAASARGLYRITDNFFRFWFSFLFPNMSDLETGDTNGVFKYIIEPRLNNFASPIFETVCLEFLRKKNRLGKLPFRVFKLGRWWGKPVDSEIEIDIVATDITSKNYILGECKFRNSETDVSDLERLREKSVAVKKGGNIKYMLFSKAGFSKRLKEQAERDKNLQLFSLSDIIQELSPCGDSTGPPQSIY